MEDLVDPEYQQRAQIYLYRRGRQGFMPYRPVLVNPAWFRQWEPGGSTSHRYVQKASEFFELSLFSLLHGEHDDNDSVVDVGSMCFLFRYLQYTVKNVNESFPLTSWESYTIKLFLAWNLPLKIWKKTLMQKFPGQWHQFAS